MMGCPRPTYIARAQAVADRFDLDAFTSDARATLGRWQLTRAELAHRLGMGTEAIRATLRGERADFGIIVAMADELDMSIDQYRRRHRR